LTPPLDVALAATSAEDGRTFLGIDLLGDRVGAERFWVDLADRSSMVVEDVRLLSHRCGGDSPIPLPLVLGADGSSEPKRMVFLTDNFVRLRGNLYFFERRMQVRSDDIVVDLHGNAVLARELAAGAWPGEKIR
jgi:hypothetical protein